MVLFSRSMGSDLWVLLLEKAFAKVHGNYHNLKGGYLNEALLDLTGCPTKVISLIDDTDTQKDLQSGKFFL